MTSPTRLVTALSALAAVLLVAGCTVGPGGAAPYTTSDPSTGPGDTGGGEVEDMDGVLLDDGRMFAVVTWGSSTCIPQVDTVSANGQTVEVSLVDADAAAACTSDMAPRASVGALPEGVDPAQDITLNVTYGEASEDVDISGGSFSGVPGESTEYLPSAGWIDDGTLVLLTWGSSGCPPVVETLEATGNAGTATFVTDADKVCTMDMAPRATLLAFGEDAADDDDFTLTLVGGGLDGTVEVPAD